MDLTNRYVAPSTILAAAVVAGLLSPTDPRLLNTLLSAMALGGLVFRIITTWNDEDMPALVHALAALLALVFLFGAVVSIQLEEWSSTAATWPLLILRAAAIELVICWPLLKNRRGSALHRGPVGPA